MNTAAPSTSTATSARRRRPWATTTSPPPSPPNNEEGIYLGYRYYETAAEEGFIDYDEAVVYPFGYGLSYSEFLYSDPTWSVSGNVITATVTVKNDGDYAGKDVVQLYYSAPYTEGGIEKSSVVLGGFAKTDLIAPAAPTP